MKRYLINGLLMYIYVYLHPLEPLQEIMFLISIPIFTELRFKRIYLAVKLHITKNLSCDHTVLKHRAERAQQQSNGACHPSQDFLTRIRQCRGRVQSHINYCQYKIY